MKTLKTVGFACALVLASCKIFAQTADNKSVAPQKTENTDQKPVVEDDQVNSFFQKYQAYLASQKPQDKKPAAAKVKVQKTGLAVIANNIQSVGTLPVEGANVTNVSPADVNQAYAASQYISQELTIAKSLNSKGILSAGSSNEEISRLQALNNQLNLNYLSATIDSRVSPPPTARPAEPTLSDKEQMIKKALAEKEKLDKQNAESTEKPAN